MRSFCNRHGGCFTVSLQVSCFVGCRNFDSRRSEPLPILTKGEDMMKIVVVRSPKAFRGILRLIFGIKRQENVA